MATDEHIVHTPIPVPNTYRESFETSHDGCYSRTTSVNNSWEFQRFDGISRYQIRRPSMVVVLPT